MTIMLKITYPATIEKPEGEYKEQIRPLKYIYQKKWLGIYIVDCLSQGAKIEMVEIKD